MDVTQHSAPKRKGDRDAQHTAARPGSSPRVFVCATHGQLPVGRLVNSKKTPGLGVALPSRPAFLLLSPPREGGGIGRGVVRPRPAQRPATGFPYMCCDVRTDATGPPKNVLAVSERPDTPASRTLVSP